MAKCSPNSARQKGNPSCPIIVQSLGSNNLPNQREQKGLTVGPLHRQSRHVQTKEPAHKCLHSCQTKANGGNLKGEYNQAFFYCTRYVIILYLCFKSLAANWPFMIKQNHFYIVYFSIIKITSTTTCICKR